MEEKRNEITVTLVLQREIAKKLAVTERTVQSALRFETNSPCSQVNPGVCLKSWRKNVRDH